VLDQSEKNAGFPIALLSYGTFSVKHQYYNLTFTLSVVNRYTGEQNNPRKYAESGVFLYIFLAVMLTIC